MKKSAILEAVGVYTVLTGAALFCAGLIAVLFGGVRFWGFCTVAACFLMVFSLVFMVFADEAATKEKQLNK